jgi:hypothetical protein
MGEAREGKIEMQTDKMLTTPDYGMMTEGELYKSMGFDAQKWAEAFCHIFAGQVIPNEDVMHTWFAAALMRGYDESGWRAEAAKKALEPNVKA